MVQGGYEEAACQGFIAGVNAARKILGKREIIIERSEGYIGVLIDDIIKQEDTRAIQGTTVKG